LALQAKNPREDDSCPSSARHRDARGGASAAPASFGRASRSVLLRSTPMHPDALTFGLAKTLAKRHGTPILALSREKLASNFADLRKALPSVELYYAIKANPHRDILKLLHQAGSRFDVSSIEEIRMARRAGAAPDDLLYTKPINKPAEIEFAHAAGLRWFVVDNEHEIAKLARSAPGANVLFRLRVSTKDAVVDLSFKFGAHADDVLRLVEAARAAKLRPRGLSFHVGSQCTNPFAYADAISMCRKLFSLAASRKILFDTLDIGGGFPVSYVESVMPIDRFCEPISEALEKYFDQCRVIAEPGRFLVANAVWLITQVVGKSRRAGVPWYYIDDGLYGSFSGRLFDKCDYTILSERDGARELCVIAGPTCDSFDVLYTDRALAPVDIGDLLIVPGMGAYTNASASTFNGFPVARLVTF
jgi:ornithine decarboxylase